MTNQCVDVGEANPDIAGVGILLSLGIQALLSIIICLASIWIEAVISFLEENGIGATVYANRDVETWKQLGKSAQVILKTNSDAQNFIGISLLITALAQIDTLTFYHMHLIYDTVAFVCISTFAAAINSLDPRTTAGTIRIYTIYVWAIFYLAYTILFGRKLQGWDYTVPAHCYNTHNLAIPSSHHPLVDNIYISITCVYIFFCLLCVYTYIHFSKVYQDFQRKEGKPEMADGAIELGKGAQYMILLVAFLQFPLHAYSIIVLRKENESLLTGGLTEQEWGFGQVSAMILLAPNAVGLVLGVSDFISWGKRQREQPSVDVHEGDVEAPQEASLEVGEMPMLGPKTAVLDV